MGSASAGNFGGAWPFELGGLKRSPKRTVTAVVFGSGGARGWAHIGVLKAFREVGFKPDIVAGASIGSVAAAVYAVDALDELIKFSDDLDWFKATQLFVEFGVHRSGLIEGRKVTDFLESVIKVKTIEELPIPFAAVATDLFTSEEVVFKSGPLMQALRSSFSIPGIFTPVHVGTRHLVDGGLVNPMPMNVAREMGATHIIAVNINNNYKYESLEETSNPDNLSHVFHRHFHAIHPNAEDEKKGDEGASDGGQPSSRTGALMGGVSGLVKKLPVKRHKEEHALDMNLFDVFTRSLRIAEDKITTECIRTNPPDLLIEPAVGDIPTMDFSRSAEAIRAGYEAAMAALR